MKKATVLLIFVFGFFNNLASLSAEFYWNIGAGLNITNEANYGIDTYEYYGDVPPYYTQKVKWDTGSGGYFFAHIGIGDLKYIFIETGLDIFIHNSFSRNLSYLRFTSKTYTAINYSSIDIPIIINMPLPFTDNFIIKPNIGFYMSFPVGELNVKGDFTGYADPDSHYDETFFVETTCSTGIQFGLKFEFYLSDENKIILGINYKRDFIPIRGHNIISDFTNTLSVTRQAIPIFVGFERIF